MTCGIANADEEQFVCPFGESNGIGVPHLPRDGVVHVAADLWHGQHGVRAAGRIARKQLT